MRIKGVTLVLMRNDQMFVWRVFPSTRISLLLTALLFPFGLFLPNWCGWENGPIENTQIAILATGVILSWKAARRNSTDKEMKDLWLLIIPIWLLIIGRELSWGRVFLDPITIGPEGPVFPALHTIWYGKYVYPINTVIIGSIVSGLWKCGGWSRIMQIRYPAIETILLILNIVASQFIFEKGIILSLGVHSQMLEEWSELTTYWCMVSTVLIIGFRKEDRRVLQSKNIDA